ncbi:TNF receptor-associated factor 4 [Oopsacas minuta]|uniref:TNF receptor-associated factor 4 n=1 Tax=Oopsacas minuta TaxID=111878 RepID=A0AAV7JEL1_9METZ|nr:TNF receptor-associated factor 4 [Oopsacas minuta]
MASKIVSNDYSYTNLQKDAVRKTYNTVDSIKQLLWVETSKNTFRGYKQDLLVNSLTEIEVEFYVCTECHGVMRNACQIGKEQTYACELCVRKGVPSQMMTKSRKRILELRAKCPLATRGCKWDGKIADVECHLNSCQEFVIQCNNCDVILKRSELENHNNNECLKRKISCTHCRAVIVFKDVDKHNNVCKEYSILCPNNCKLKLKRKQLEAHVNTDCPNTIVECPYRKYGCKQEVKRCELQEHKDTNQIKHLESTILFGISRIEQMEIRNTELEKRVERLSYPVVLRSFITEIAGNRIPTFGQFFNIIRNNFKIYWRFLKIILEFSRMPGEKTISVTITMDYDQYRSPLAKWPFEGRFKLTILDQTNINNFLVYESDIVKLQPAYEPDCIGLEEESKYPFKLVLPEIPVCSLEERYISKGDKRIPFTLQIQEAEDVLITDSIK